MTWGMGAGLWRRGPGAKDPVEFINAIPAGRIGGRPVPRIATHLTRSVDGREFFVDAHIGMQYVFGTLPVDGGPFEEWYNFERNYNHAQINPTDPDEVLFAQENHSDPITGLTFKIENRLWIMRRGGKPRPILREPLWVTHEWWDPDGKHVWCVWGNETWKVRVSDGEVEKIPFPHHTWHSHSSRLGEYIIGDLEQPLLPRLPVIGAFYEPQDRQTGQAGGKPGTNRLRRAQLPYRPAPALQLQ